MKKTAGMSSNPKAKPRKRVMPGTDGTSSMEEMKRKMMTPKQASKKATPKRK
jgi:hypothetical protein